MSDISNKCVLLKNLPSYITQNDVFNILESENLHTGVDKLQAHTERHDDKRWIILFKTEEDATRCFNHGQWKATVGEETVTAVPDFCSECIIPDAWTETVEQSPERSWIMVEPENYSSVSSGELFAGESMPFQYSESGNRDKTMIEKGVYKYKPVDDDDSLSTSHDLGRSSPVFYSNLSDSALFGSGYKKNFQGPPDSSTTSTSAVNTEASSCLLLNTQTTKTCANENVHTEYDVPKGTRSDTLSDVRVPEMKIISTESSIQSKTIVSENAVHQTLDQSRKDRPDVTQLSVGSSGNIRGMPTARTGGISESETGVENTTSAPYQVPQNANVGTMEMNEQQRISQFPYYTGQPAYPYFGFQMPPYYPGFFGPMPGTRPNQQQQFIMPFPTGIPPQHAGLGENASSNSQGINQQLPLCSPQNFYNPYMFPPYGNQMYPPNFPVMPGQLKPPGDMAQAMYSQADGHTYKTPVSQKEVAPNPKKPIVTDDDTQDYIIPVSAQPDQGSAKHNDKLEVRLHANDGVHTKDINSETSSESKLKGRVISIDAKEIPQLPRRKHPSEDDIKAVENTEENVYDEIPADILSLDQEVTLRHPYIKREFSPVRNAMIGRELPPVPLQDRKPPSSGANQHDQDSLNNVGDRRSLPTSITKDASQKTDDAFIKSRRHFSCADGEKLSKTAETRAKQIEEATNKIMVTGYKESSSLESLGFFFENKRKSGGDEIVASELIKDPDAIIIEFRDSSVVESVLKKQEAENFKLDGAVLKVRPYIAPPIDDYKIFLSGVRDGVSRESLEIFVEVVAGLSPVAVDYGETPGTVMLTFDEPPDFENFKQSLKKRTLEDQIVTVSQVEVSNRVEVTGYDSSVTHDTMMFYFENKRSGGGEIVHIKKETSRSIVQFRYADDARRVCDGRKHFLDEKELNVSLYYKCMDLDRNFEVKIPQPLVLNDINRNILKFLKATTYKDRLGSVLKNTNGDIDWSSSADDKLIIRCTLDSKEKESVRLVKTWSRICTDAVNGVIDTLDVNEDIIVQQEIWSKSIDALGDLDVSNPDEVAVFIRKEELKIVVCGEKQAVAELSEQISRILEETEKKTIEDSRETKKTIILKVYQVTLLKTLTFFNESNFKAFNVTVEIKGSREIIFSGQKCSIDKIISTMYEQLKGFARRSFVAIKPFKDMMFEKEVRDYIKKSMKQQKVTGVWDVIRGDDSVYMYSKTDKQAQIAIDIVNKCLVQRTLPLDLKMEDQIDGDTGKKMVSKLLESNKGLIKLEKTTGQLLIITVDYLMEKVCEEIKLFLDLHMITEEFLDVISGRLDFINQFFRDRLDQIETQYRSLSVVIEQQETQYRQGFKVKGQKDGCKLALHQLRKLIENVFIEQHTIESQYIDVRHFFEITPGRNELMDIQMKEKCVLKLKPGNGTSMAKHTALKMHAECSVNTCKIKVLEGDLTELQDEVDVIVNPRNLSMSNTEGLSGAIIQKGGYDIEKECGLFLKNHQASYGDVFVGGAGKLRCKNIFHVIAPEWRGGSHNEEKILRTTVKNCFDKMLEKKLTSIAMSAVGTGRFRFPRNGAIENTVNVLETYVNTQETPFVKEVFLCDLRHDNVKCFVNELKKTFNHITVYDLKDQPDEEGSADEDESPVYSRRQRLGRRSDRDNQARNIKVVMVEGELARQKVDAVVNSTNTNLDLKVGTLSRSLLKGGGETILQELQQKYPDGVTLEKVAVSSGGNLLCKEIYHGVLVKWDKGQGAAEKVMETFIRRCLKLADERGMNSIAFPALGTGVLGFPADRVARLLYETIHDYDTNHPDTGISSVLLVVYQEDDPTLRAFRFVKEKVKSGQLESKIGSRQTHSFAKTFSMAPADLHASHRFNIGPVAVTVLQGDITKEKTDIVVNSTVEELNLSFGAVSKAILSAAGLSLQSECYSEANRAQMKAQGYIMTSPGNMMCGKLLHIKARSRASNWEEAVMKCLKLVEADGASSVSFPALGTGGKGCNPDSVAKNMFSALRKYIQSSDYNATLKSIRIVIFQADMVKTFVDASKEESKGSFKFLDKFMHKPKLSKVVFCIYAESAFRINKVKGLLDAIFVEENVYHRKQVIEGLKPRQVEKIKRMAQDKNSSLRVKSGSLKLYGPKCFVNKVKDNIKAYLSNIEKDAAADADKGAIALPKSWGKMGLQDATKVVPLAANDIDYTNVCLKFQAEAAGTFTGIVKIERIQNPTLYTQYMAKKKQMELANPSGNVERILWHGTNYQVIDNINTKGFDRNYNSGASHGVGVYLAVKAGMSVSGYCRKDPTGQRHIYLARVLTGDFCVGQAATRLPPQKPTGNPHDRYDSTTDNVAAPNFFVIFHDAQAYPEFLITFV